MKRTTLLLTGAILAACTDDYQEVARQAELDIEAAPPTEASRTTKTQAAAIANLFNPLRGSDDGSNKAATIPAELTSVSCYVEGGDTLLFAFNYGDQEGYMVVSADLSHFPIVAKAETGSVDFENMDAADPFSAYVSNLAAGIRESMASEDRDTAYANLWADVLNPEYEYVVTMPDEEEEAAEPGTNKATRTPTGRAAIPPYTGIALRAWGQDGDYSSAAKDGLIGCPAVAIGMMLFDTQYRSPLQLGKTRASVETTPSFGIFDMYPYRAKEVSQKLHSIADKTPNYGWNINPNRESGVQTEWDILQGLRNVGFTRAKLKLFNFEDAYTALCASAPNSDKTLPPVATRGMLLSGRNSNGAGHVWFCDGYKEMSYKVTKWRKVLFWKKKIGEWTEYANFFYMNWGWCGRQNGWYGLEADNKMTEEADTPHRYGVCMYVNLWYNQSK